MVALGGAIFRKVFPYYGTKFGDFGRLRRRLGRQIRLCGVDHTCISGHCGNVKNLASPIEPPAIPHPTNLARRPLSATQAATDEVLIARIAQGDRLAMQVLYGRHHVRVFRFGLRLVRDEQIAEDLISEVFLDVWRQAGKFEGRSAVSTWLLAITRFKALSALTAPEGR